MRIVWLCPLLLTLVACSAPNPPSATNDSPATPSSTVASNSAASTQAPLAPTPSADDAWQLSQKNSPMDGQIVRATRIYKFPDMDTTVQVEFVCTVENKQLQITLTSIVGSIDNPSNASLFQRDLTYVKGRIKFSNLPPDELFSTFKLSDNFGNVITQVLHTTSNNGVMEGNGIFMNYLAQEGVGSQQIKEIEGRDFSFNATAALSKLFPIAIEAINGRGTLDFVVAKSKSVSVVLDQCGGNGPVIDPALSQLVKSSAATIDSANTAARQDGPQNPANPSSSMESVNIPASAQTSN